MRIKIRQLRHDSPAQEKRTIKMRHKIQPLTVNEKLTVFYYYGTLENIHIRANIKKRVSYKRKTTQLQNRTDRKKYI